LSYIVPYGRFLEWLSGYNGETQGQYKLRYDLYISLIRRFLEPIVVDETWYADEYPGVARGVSAGRFKSCRQHYLVHGYFEGRRPFPKSAGGKIPKAFAAVAESTTFAPSRDGLYVVTTLDVLTNQIRSILAATPVDEGWYRSTYPSADRAIATGRFASARQHFVTYGYEEGRWPFEMMVDEEWYLSRYKDVARSISNGTLGSAKDHFKMVGYQEGRFPAPPSQSNPLNSPPPSGALQ